MNTEHVFSFGIPGIIARSSTGRDNTNEVVPPAAEVGSSSEVESAGYPS